MGFFKSDKDEFSEEDRDSFISSEYADKYIKKPKYEEPDISENVVTGAVEDDDDTCDICGEKLGFFTRNKVVKNFYICNECADKSGIMRHLKEVKKLPADVVERIIIKKMDKAGEFLVTNSVDKYFFVDKEMEMWTIPYVTGLTKSKVSIDPEEIYPMEIIDEYYLIEDEREVAKGGRDLEPIRGLLFVGKDLAGKSDKCSKLQIKINTYDLNNPSVYIDFIIKPVDRNSSKYNNALVSAQKVLAMLENISHSQIKQEARDLRKENPDKRNQEINLKNIREDEKDIDDFDIKVPIYEPDPEEDLKIDLDREESIIQSNERRNNVKVLNVDEINRRIHPTKREGYVPSSQKKTSNDSYGQTRVFKAKESVDKEKIKPYYQSREFSVTEEIKKYKELLDMGAITEEEYNVKKKQLLDL